MLASEVLPVMLDTVQVNPDDSLQRKMFKDLSGWKYQYDPETLAPSYFNTWFYFLEKLAWDELEGKVPLPRPDEYQLSWLLRRFPHDSIFDIRSTKKTETYVDLVRQSFSLAADSVRQWGKLHGMPPVWYKFKNTRISHLVPQFHAFSDFDIPVGGYKHIINACSETEGPSWRLVIQLGDTLSAWGIYPGGQSGNPGSPYYSSFEDLWAKGNYLRILFLKDETQAAQMPGGKLVILNNK